MADPHFAVIEGRVALVTERTPPLPDTLSLLVEGGRDRKGRMWHPLRVTDHRPLLLMGARSACMAQEHRLARWLSGWHTGSDNTLRFLRLEACADCGSVCVRDRSIDVLDGLPTGGRDPAQKDHVIAWYSGARPANRTFGRSITS